LGLKEEEFWKLTPAKLFSLVDRKNEQIKREDYRAGVVTMLIRSACGMKRAHPFDDFPQHKESRNVKNPSPADVRANFRAYMEAKKVNG